MARLGYSTYWGLSIFERKYGHLASRIEPCKRSDAVIGMTANSMQSARCSGGFGSSFMRVGHVSTAYTVEGVMMHHGPSCKADLFNGVLENSGP